MGVTDFLLLSCLGFAITAHAQDCAVPDGGPNMHLKDEYILKDTFSDGDQAAFECAIGYISAGGSSSITCTAGTWSTVRLKCDRRNCGSPGELLNGLIRYPKENLFGDHIEMTCDEGYRIVGRSTIVCGANGWLGRMPKCEVMTCDEPPQVKGASFTPYKDPYNFEDVVQYSCQNGLTLNGSASISCSEDGTFKPDPPTCTSVQCENLDLPNLDWVSGSRPPHKYKAKVTYRCRTGYKMVGSATLTCDINSQWSPGLPRCEMMTCNRPLRLDHGSFSPDRDSYNYEDNVEFMCQTGFKLKVPPAGGDKPGVCCREPHIDYGYIKDARPPYRPNDEVRFECSTGYLIEGNRILACQAAGDWSSLPPKCNFNYFILLFGLAIPFLAATAYKCYRDGVSPCRRRSLADRYMRRQEGNVTNAEQEELEMDYASPRERLSDNVQASGDTVDEPPVLRTSES